MTTIAAFAVILAGAAGAQQPVFPTATNQKSLTPAEMAARSSALVEKAYSEVMASLATTERCFNAEAEMAAANARKTKELAAEFGGKVPVAFADLQAARAQRLNRAHTECVGAHAETSRLLAEAFGTLRHSVPVSPNYKPQKAKLDAANEKIRKLMPGGPARPAGKKGAAKQGGGEGPDE